MKVWGTTIAILLIVLVVILGFYLTKPKVRQANPAVGSTNTTANGTMDKKTAVLLETNYGPIKISLDEDAAPKTTANFKKLVSEKFYDNLTFHRIVPGFVIQGGDPKGDGTGGPGYTVPAEIKLLHKRGSVAMARLPDQINPQRDSSGSQFYIALQDLPMLDGQYTVFGEVISGMEIVDKIAQVPTDQNDKPLEPVTIKKATLEEQQ